METKTNGERSPVVGADFGGLRIFRNAAAVAIGRNLNSLGRLLIAAIVVRGLGAEGFGVYSVVVALLAIADWLLDFGTTDVFVREVVRDPSRYARLRKTLIALKLFQAPLSIAIMLLALIAFRFSDDVTRAAMIAGLSLLFFWATAVYRSVFKASLTMEREMLAEFISVIAMIPMAIATIHLGFGTDGLIVALVVSRATFLAGCVFFARGDRGFSVAGTERTDLIWLARSSFVIGVIGLLISINNAIEIILLTGISQLADVALFSAAQKLVLPVFMVLGAIGVSYYPVLASQYTENRGKYLQSCQQLFDLVALLGGAAICGVWAGADFLLNILGEQMLPAANALRALVVAYVIRSFAGAIGPVLFIVHAQNIAIRFYAIALAMKIIAIIGLAPIYGFWGAALVTLVAEAVYITPVTLYYVWRTTGFRPNFTTGIKTGFLTLVSLTIANLTVTSGTFACAVVATTCYGISLLIFRVVRLRSARELFPSRS